MQELPHMLPEASLSDSQDGADVDVASTDLAIPETTEPGDLQRLAGQSVEVLDLYGQITSLVQQHLTQLTGTAERLRADLSAETAQVASLQAERIALQQELDTLRSERDHLRQDLETMVQTGLARRRELAAEIEQFER